MSFKNAISESQSATYWESLIKLIHAFFISEKLRVKIKDNPRIVLKIHFNGQIKYWLKQFI